MRKTIAAIDPSLTGTALCVWASTGDIARKRISSDAAPGLVSRISRYEALAEEVITFIGESCGGLDEVCAFIEGYSYGSPNRAVPLAEYGGILRSRLLGFTPRVVEVTPSQLKKFATGKGAGKGTDKLGVALACQKRWGVSYTTSDEFDAYVLARIGRCYVGLEEPETAFQREVVEELKHGKAKKRRNQNPVSHE